MAKIADFRLDEATWASGSDARRLDWRVLLGELVEHGEFVPPLAGGYLLVTLGEDDVVLEALAEDGAVVHAERIAWAPLKDAIAEYVAIIDQLDGGGHHRNAELFATLDMAKKVVHDRAAAALLKSGLAAASENATLRRLFSLLFALRVDTSRMRYANGHREL